MLRFEINQRVVEVATGKRATVFCWYPEKDDLTVTFDESPKWCSTHSGESFVYEPTDGTVLPQHRAKSSGALMGGWR